METFTDGESANLNDNLATWNQPRTCAELRSFVARHEDALDVEDFML